MSRDLTDPRIVEILAAFVRQLRDEPPHAVDGFMCVVIGTEIDRFVSPGGWSAEGIRAVLEMFLQHAPDEDLDDMLASSRREQAMMDSFDRGEDHWDEHAGFVGGRDMAGTAAMQGP